MRSQIINLGTFSPYVGGLTSEEDAIIDRAITETYALKDINADSDFKNVEPPLLSDFEMVLGGMEGENLWPKDFPNIQKALGQTLSTDLQT